MLIIFQRYFRQYHLRKYAFRYSEGINEYNLFKFLEAGAALKCHTQVKAQRDLYTRIGRKYIAVGKMPDVDFRIELPGSPGIYAHAHEIAEREFPAGVLSIYPDL